MFWDVLTAYNEENGTNFRFDAFECGNYLFKPFDVDVADYLEEMSKYDYFDELGEISTHTYGANDSVSARKKFAAFMEKNYPELEVTATEFCEMESGEYDTIESGMFLAKVILRDLTMIDATEWSWWLSVAAGGYNDGLVYWNGDRDPKVWVLNRYYTMGQITRFLDPGDVRVESAISDLTGWAGVDIGVFVKPDGTVVAIVVNDGGAKDLKLNGMEKFGGTSVQVTRTTQMDKWEESDFVFDGSLPLAEDSVTTFVLPGGAMTDEIAKLSRLTARGGVVVFGGARRVDRERHPRLSFARRAVCAEERLSARGDAVAALLLFAHKRIFRLLPLGDLVLSRLQAEPRAHALRGVGRERGSSTRSSPKTLTDFIPPPAAKRCMSCTAA